MSSCGPYNPECVAKLKYLNDKSNFDNNRILDATVEYKDQIKLLNTRTKNKDWKNIYPINNHDFNYKEYILNKYNPYKLGISNTPTIKNLMNSSIKLGDYNKAILFNPTPNKDAISGISDVNNSDIFVQNELIKLKNNYDKMPYPYPSFKKDYPEKLYPTKGLNSSSYFMKVGECKTNDNKTKCIKKKFKWVPNIESTINLKNINGFFKTNQNSKINKKIINGTCYKPKFIYLDNKAKGNNISFNGLVSSLSNDIMSITPEKLMAIISGYRVGGGGLLPCSEDFTNYNTKIYNFKYLIYFILLITILIMFYKFVF
jgi:hypothetical protein